MVGAGMISRGEMAFDHFANWTAKSIDRTTVLFTFSNRDFIKYTYFSTCSEIFYKKVYEV